MEIFCAAQSESIESGWSEKTKEKKDELLKSFALKCYAIKK